MSVVIPAWNEGARVGAVVAAARAAPSVDRVIVVDDGSTDGTAQAAMAAGAEVVVLGRRHGKGTAMAVGAQVSSSPVLAFLDADLRGLEPAHVERLAEPVAGGRADMAIAHLDGQPERLVPYISGQRVVADPEGLVPGAIYGRGYSAEVALTRLVRSRGGRIEIVRWAGVGHWPKWAKRPWWAALAGHIDTWRAVAGAMATA